MATDIKYVMPVEETDWNIGGEIATTLRWEYDDGRDSLLELYQKGKKQQWKASERIDWSMDLDPENPIGVPDIAISIFGSDMWRKMTDIEKVKLHHHSQAWQISQFLHDEQGALACITKIVQQVPQLNCAATQVIDEARHVEAYSRLLRDKFELAYPITAPLKSLLENIISDSRWDFTYLARHLHHDGCARPRRRRYRGDAGGRPARSGRVRHEAECHCVTQKRSRGADNLPGNQTRLAGTRVATSETYSLANGWLLPTAHRSSAS